MKLDVVCEVVVFILIRVVIGVMGMLKVGVLFGVYGENLIDSVDIRVCV